ncbi:YXWGXW repeat-containing protein [Actimicrobium antarcticum]|uniref:YXWGXW repeat-containing protein n=1 Tax=Actimicrobium antarcticum TaxID=1051899 RepID=A0ABP7TK64_9BURK
MKNSTKRIILTATAILISTAALLPTTASAQVGVNVIIGNAPPPVRYEVVPQPRRGYEWAPGYWNWSGQRHVWSRGHWERSRPGYQYMRPEWRQDGERWRLERGGWQRGNHGNGYGRGRGDQDHDGIPNRYDRDRDGDGVRNRNDRNPGNSHRN